jgi:hypothetical protein
VGSKTYDGVWFISFSHDHAPPHVHGEYGEVSVVVDLLPDGRVRESNRYNAVTPSNGKRSDVRHIVKVAAAHSAALMQLWEKTHGKTS